MTTSPAAERLKVEALALMIEHAAIPPRGWDALRERAALHRRIDVLLDRHALELLLIAESVPRSVDTA